MNKNFANKLAFPKKDRRVTLIQHNLGLSALGCDDEHLRRCLCVLQVRVWLGGACKLLILDPCLSQGFVAKLPSLKVQLFLLEATSRQ